jgi:hypothetical protein
MSSLADAVQQLVKGNVPAHIYEVPDTVVMQNHLPTGVPQSATAVGPVSSVFGPPTTAKATPVSDARPAPLPLAAAHFCSKLRGSYPGMQMIVTLQEKTPLRIDPSELHPTNNVCFSVAREKVLSSETCYTLQRQRWLHPDTLALPDEDLHRLVAKRMRVDARAAARTVADPKPVAAPAPGPTNRAGVEIVDDRATYPRQLVKLITHVSSVPLLYDAVQQGLLSGTQKAPKKWDQSVHDECDFVGSGYGGQYCGNEACAYPSRLIEEPYVTSVSIPGTCHNRRRQHREAFACPPELNESGTQNMRTVRRQCLRCRMQVGYVPNVMLAARQHMGNDCWEDGLKVVLEVGYEGPAAVVMRVERGPACPPTEEREAEPTAAAAAAAAAEPVCGDEEL